MVRFPLLEVLSLLAYLIYDNVIMRVVPYLTKDGPWETEFLTDGSGAHSKHHVEVCNQFLDTVSPTS